MRMLLLCLVILCGCEPVKFPPSKFSLGEKVEMIDGTKAVVTHIYINNVDLEISYFDKDGEYQSAYVKDFELEKLK